MRHPIRLRLASTIWISEGAVEQAILEDGDVEHPIRLYLSLARWIGEAREKLKIYARNNFILFLGKEYMSLIVHP